MKGQKILHLNSYYIDNHLYAQLYKKLDDFVNQVVFIPIKLNRKPENIVELENMELIFDRCIRPFHKYNYFGKISFLSKRLFANGYQEDVNFVHAHNLFTDGAIAFEIYKKFNIPYIVALRGTDINLQYKFMLHRRSRANKILKHAHKIIFISIQYHNRFFDMLPKVLRNELSKKSLIIPNGINDSWLANPYPSRKFENKENFRLVYVGQIMRTKNLNKLIEAISSLNTNSINYSLTVVGGENHNEPEYFQEFLQLTQMYSWIEYKGIIKNPLTLREVLRSCDIFTMPSIAELFGLVYVEALTQGLPILYSSGEGIDGYFNEESVGKAVDPNDVNAISESIKAISKNNYQNLYELTESFDWNKIAKKYVKFYKTNE